MSARKELGRQVTRRLSLMARVPSLIQNKLRFDYNNDADRRSSAPKKTSLKKPRSVTVHVTLPGGHLQTITGSEKATIGQLLEPIAAKLNSASFRLRMRDTSALVWLQAEAYLLDGEHVALEPANRWRSSDDMRFSLTEELLRTQRELARDLKTLNSVYVGPLLKLSVITEEEARRLTEGVGCFLTAEESVARQLEHVLGQWNSTKSLIGEVFSEEFWNTCDEYLKFLTGAITLLRAKEATDEDFVEICKLRRGAAYHTVGSLLHLPVDRLVDYNRYLAGVLRETGKDHPDWDRLVQSLRRTEQLLQKCEPEVNSLDRIQDLFPNDALHLRNQDAVTLNMKGLNRKTTLQRAFSSKNRSATDPTHPAMTDAIPEKRRQFLMEAPVTFTMGLQCQDRHLFLFTDLLLVAKSRSGGNFKLKEKVVLSELWLSRCLDQVCEVAKSPESSFVIGWPTVNVVVTFSCAATRDIWWSKLGHVIAEERQKEPRSTNIQVAFNDTLSGIEYLKTLSVSPDDSAKDCIRMALSHLELSEADVDNYRLWVKTIGDDAPYPLVGHESPYSIKLHYVRKSASEDQDPNRIDHCNNVNAKCQFILKKVRSADQSEEKCKPVKTKRSPGKIQNVFRRAQSRPDIDVVDSAGSSSPTGALFGQQLPLICSGQQLPRPLYEMLSELRQNGPKTVGIFRKSANARQVRELRQQLDASAQIEWSTVSPVVIAAVVKEFLRSLPDCVLLSGLYQRWLQAADPANYESSLNRIKTLCGELPLDNMMLLRHFVCVLAHIAANSDENMMSPANLAVCVGPSLLWTNQNRLNDSMDLKTEAVASKQIPALVTLLIEQCAELFGADTLTLFDRCPGHFEKKKAERKNSPVQKKIAKHGQMIHQNDSGIEETDSIHGSHHFDNSSMDSLERECFNAGLDIQRLRGHGMSVSHDSGLTLSDSHLYMPDEEGSESASSGRGSDKIVKRPVPNYEESRRRIHKATPTVILQEEFHQMPSSYHAAPRYQQPGGVLRRKSHLQQKPERVNFEPKLRRSASDESLNQEILIPKPLSRVRSRITKSQPAIDEADGNTLSDNDSTPRVSRSSSRVKDFNTMRSAYGTGESTVPSVHIRITQDGRNSIIYPRESPESSKLLKKRKDRTGLSRTQRGIPSQSFTSPHWNTWGGAKRPTNQDVYPQLPPKQLAHLKNPHGCVRVRPRPVRIHMDESILRDAELNGQRSRKNVSVVSITDNYTPLHRSFAFSTDTLKHAMESGDDAEGWNRRSVKAYCEVGTQTHPDDIASGYSGASRLARNKSRDSSSLNRSRSMPPKDQKKVESDTEEEYMKPRVIPQRMAPPSYRHPPSQRYPGYPQRLRKGSSTDSFEKESYV